MSEDFPVEVKIHVPASRYVKLLRFAEANDTTVANVLTQLVARSMAPKGKPRKKRVEITPQLRQEIVSMALNRIPQKDIAEKLNLSASAVSTRLKELGIRS